MTKPLRDEPLWARALFWLFCVLFIAVMLAYVAVGWTYIFFRWTWRAMARQLGRGRMDPDGWAPFGLVVIAVIVAVLAVFS